MSPLRNAIQVQVRQMFGAGSADAPAPDAGDAGGLGDPGLFGPQSACWRVHGDFTSMMVGGVAALLLQMLHPAALAGVWDHSNFRRDMAGRLRRTARFVAGTTYGSTAEAEALIARVRAVHAHIKGDLPEGGAYAADDPALLTWVHVAEMSSFLKAYMRYRDPLFSPADQDRYFAETATIARRLGATKVPTSRAEIEIYLQAMRPQLRCDARTRDAARTVLSQRSDKPAVQPLVHLMLQSSKDLLPDWAARMHGFPTPLARKPAIRLGTGAMGQVMRWALQDGARRGRGGGPPA